MSFIYIFSAFAIGAYLLQIVLGFFQMKHFNQTYQLLRQNYKVAIGKRAGGIRSGTIVLFAIDDDGIIYDTYLMQGVTIFARFKRESQFNGLDLHYLDHYHPQVRRENKLVIAAIEDARHTFLSVETQTPISRPLSWREKLSSFFTHLKINKDSKGVF